MLLIFKLIQIILWFIPIFVPNSFLDGPSRSFSRCFEAQGVNSFLLFIRGESAGRSMDNLESSWNLHPWRCPDSYRTLSWSICSGWAFHEQEGWIRWSPEVPASLKCSLIPWKKAVLGCRTQFLEVCEHFQLILPRQELSCCVCWEGPSASCVDPLRGILWCCFLCQRL